MAFRLLVAGSNSGGQLGLGHRHDVHRLHPAEAEAELERGRGGGGADDDGGDDAPRPFPPRGWAIRDLASGANHTLAVLASSSSSSPRHRGPRQLWGTGDNSQGQLGARTRRGGEGTDDASPASRFVRLDPPWPGGVEPVRVVCGWDSSYIALRRNAEGDEPDALEAVRGAARAARPDGGGDEEDDADDDVLLVLGTTNDFGQLGTPKETPRSARGDDFQPKNRVLHLRTCVTQALSADHATATPWPPRLGRLRIVDLACSPRHFVALCRLSGHAAAAGGSVLALVGFGASRAGQLGEAARGDKVVWSPRLVAAWREGGSHRGRGADEAGVGTSESPAGVAKTPPTGPPRVAAGKEHTAVLLPGAAFARPIYPRGEDQTWREPPGADAHSTAPRLVVLGSDRHGQARLASYLSRVQGRGRDDVRVHHLGCNWSTTLVSVGGRSDSEGGGEDDTCGATSVIGSGRSGHGQLGGASSAGLDPAPDGDEGVCEVELPADRTEARRPLRIEALRCGSEHTLCVRLLGGGSRRGSARHRERPGTTLPSRSTVDEDDASEDDTGDSTPRPGAASPPAREVVGWGWNEHGNLATGDERDVWRPVRLWPPDDDDDGGDAPAGDDPDRGQARSGGRPARGSRPPTTAVATDAWAGCGTSFIQVFAPTTP